MMLATSFNERSAELTLVLIFTQRLM